MIRGFKNLSCEEGLKRRGLKTLEKKEEQTKLNRSLKGYYWKGNTKAGGYLN